MSGLSYTPRQDDLNNFKFNDNGFRNFIYLCIAVAILVLILTLIT